MEAVLTLFVASFTLTGTHSEMVAFDWRRPNDARRFCISWKTGKLAGEIKGIISIHSNQEENYCCRRMALNFAEGKLITTIESQTLCLSPTKIVKDGEKLYLNPDGTCLTTYEHINGTLVSKENASLCVSSKEEDLELVTCKDKLLRNGWFLSKVNCDNTNDMQKPQMKNSTISHSTHVSRIQEHSVNKGITSSVSCDRCKSHNYPNSCTGECNTLTEMETTVEQQMLYTKEIRYFTSSNTKTVTYTDVGRVEARLLNEAEKSNATVSSARKPTASPSLPEYNKSTANSGFSKERTTRLNLMHSRMILKSVKDRPVFSKSNSIFDMKLTLSQFIVTTHKNTMIFRETLNVYRSSRLPKPDDTKSSGISTEIEKISKTKKSSPYSTRLQKSVLKDDSNVDSGG